MLFIGKLKFWLLALLILCYILGVLVLSVITLHGLKKGTIPSVNSQLELPDRRTFIYKKSNLIEKKLKNLFDYDAGAFRPVLKISKIRWCSQLKFIPLINDEEIRNRNNKPVALVSFPGSGNTWLRYLLQQATGYYTGSVYKDYGLLRNGFPAENIISSSVVAVKTHEWGKNARSMFSKALLLIRAPDKSIQAEFNRQSGGHIGFASPDRYKRSKGKYWQQFVLDNLRGWQNLNMDWIQNFTNPLHIIFYENLVDNTEQTLKSVINFLGIFVPRKNFECAIERKEGIYRRRKRVLNFDPFSLEMKEKVKQIKENVYNSAINRADIERNGE